MIKALRGAIFALLFFSCNIVFASALDSQWLKLLRYNKFGNNFESEADSKEFFLTTNGKYDPQAEYEELFKKLKEPITNENHAACRFPARSLKIIQDNKMLAPQFNKCTKLDKFLRKISPKGASLVFASYFIQKPSSAFGHTFLRLHSNKSGDSSLLDHAVDFSASVDTQNPIAYGVKGIIGGFKGRFSRMPYFLKLREYADLDSRDVWEYPLKLSVQELYFLVLHLWEMDQAYFDYYYFSENCSYHILRAVEAVTDKDLSQHLKFFVIPIDTIQAMYNEELIGEPKRIPSQYALVQNGLKSLSKENTKHIHDFYTNPFGFNLDNINDPKTLDVLIDTLNYKFAEELLTDTAPKNVNLLRNDILTRRSKLGVSSRSSVTKQVDPVDGHLGSFLNVSGFNQKTNGIFISHAFALHQFENPINGYAANSQMVMGFTELKVTKNDIDLKSFHIFDVLSAAPSFGLEFKPAWRFSLGIDTDFASDNSRAAFASIHSGISTSPFQGSLLTAFIGVRPRFETRDNKFYTPLGLSSIFIHNYSNFRYGIESSIHRNFQLKRYEFLVRPFLRQQLSQNIDSFASASIYNSDTRFNIGATFFY